MDYPDKSSFTLTREIDLGSFAADGDYVASATLLVKTAYSVADGSATFSLGATVDDSGASGGVVRLKFSVTTTQTSLCTLNRVYVLTIKLTMHSGSVYYPISSHEEFIVVSG